MRQVGWRELRTLGVVFLLSMSAFGRAHASGGELTPCAHVDRHGGADIDFKMASFYWRDTTVNPLGYLDIFVSGPQVDLVRSMMRHMIFDPQTEEQKAFDCPSQLGDLGRQGAFFESAGRLNTLYGQGDRRAVVTAWQLTDVQSISTPINAFLNTCIRGNPATLSLSRSRPPKTTGLWKLGWLERRINYEMYVEDPLRADGSPALHPKELVRMGEAYQCGVNTPR